MSDKEPLHIYLEEPLRKSAASGGHNFINLVVEVAADLGFEPVFELPPPSGRKTSGRSLSHMINPPNDKGLMFRRVYHYPFWQIEAFAQRWHWDVARATFDPDEVPSDATRFYQFWQQRLFGDKTRNASRDGFVYIPLQGQLTRQRVFQSCTPLEMVDHCLEHETKRQVIAGLHPRENYSLQELADLEALAERHPRLTIVKGNLERNLQRCDYIVTQNSGAAFSGFFFGKPAMLFGQIDFHHICEKADLQDLETSFANAAALTPAFEKYIWWFWQDQAINAGRAGAKDKIAARFKRFGWP